MGVNLSGLLRELTFEYFNIAFGKINYFRSGMNLAVIVVVVVGDFLLLRQWQHILMEQDYTILFLELYFQC